MFILLKSDKHNREQGFYSIYHNQRGVSPQKQRKLTVSVGADHYHIATVINVCLLLFLDKSNN